MFGKIKKNSVQTAVLLVNLGLVWGGVLYFKNQQTKKNASENLANNAIAEEIPVAIIDPIAEKAAQLQQIIDNNAVQASADAAKNTGQITVQKPKTVTQTIPGGTKTVNVSSTSSSSKTSTPKPAATTKKS